MRSVFLWFSLLLAAPCPAADAPPSPLRAQLDAAEALKQRLTADLVRALAEIRAAKGPAEEEEARSEAADQVYWAGINPAMGGLLAAADANPNDPAAVAALGFVAINDRARPESCRRAIALLRRDHVRSADISAATRTLFVHWDKPEAFDLLRAVAADNPSRVERGRASNDLAWALPFAADRIERSRAAGKQAELPAHLRAANPDALNDEAAALYDRCLAEYADVAIVGYGAGKTVGDFARGALADLRDLRVGRPAPEIVGEDVEGKPLRLSDHRGKPVVLVFSGEWCGPCRAAAPLLRALLTPEAQAKAPCVVLEVNTDASRDPARKAIAAGEIAWPCWFDGGTTGPITMAWGVASFPLIHVIDAGGVLRAKDVHVTDVAAALARVVAEAPAGRP